MITVILCAAGNGTRTGFPENKILRELNGMPVLCHVLSAFAPFADEMIVACRKEDEKAAIPLLAPYENARIVHGGKTRAESVYHALQAAKGEIVLVHDAARPFVTKSIIEDCIASVKARGSGVCALPAMDTTVLAENGAVCSVPARENVFTVQTPQGFYTEKLLLAYERAFADNREKSFTDDSGVYTAYVEPAVLFLGDKRNKKLTFAEDFLSCERVGFGVDTHAFAHREEFDRGIARLNLNYIRLGGATIPSDRAILAHSDGDVLVHALMDALLSAANLRDIGFYFPESDPKYKNANSMELLAKVMRMVDEAGFSVKNASVSVLAETPRLSPYIEEMRKNISAVLGCKNVAIAAGTNEKLGYVGERRGITAYAMALLTTDRG